MASSFFDYGHAVINRMDQHGCSLTRLRSLHKHSINYCINKFFFDPRCTSSTDSFTFTAQQRDLGPDLAPRQCRCIYLARGAAKQQPQGVNNDPKDLGDAGLEN